MKVDNNQANSRAGLTFSLPVDRYNLVKLFGSGGAMSPTGNDFNAVDIEWQYRRGEGY